VIGVIRSPSKDQKAKTKSKDKKQRPKAKTKSKDQKQRQKAKSQRLSANG
jgi:hypothetical protein